MLPSYLFWLLKLLLHTMGVHSFGPSDVLAWSLLSLRHLLVRLLLLPIEFKDCEAAGFAFFFVTLI